LDLKILVVEFLATKIDITPCMLMEVENEMVR
jgi:hypothetical protein